MKKTALYILIILISAGCTSSSPRGTIDATKPHLRIDISFNTETYPWIMGTKYPTFALWVREKSTGFAQTIFVTGKAGADKWAFADARPSSVPVWSGIRSGEMKAGGGKEIDSVSGATPAGEGFTLYWQIPRELMGKKLDIYLEGNISFDYNEYYSKKAGKGEAGYSDVNGQPSVVWMGSLSMEGPGSETTPVIAGRGSVLGEDNELHADLTHVTTAKEIFSYVKFRYIAGSSGK